MGPPCLGGATRGQGIDDHPIDGDRSHPKNLDKCIGHGVLREPESTVCHGVPPAWTCSRCRTRSRTSV